MIIAVASVAAAEWNLYAHVPHNIPVVNLGLQFLLSRLLISIAMRQLFAFLLHAVLNASSWQRLETCQHMNINNTA
jgi:hypothetical protein